MNAIAALALVFDRPWALGLLAIPFALVWLARRFDRPRTEYTGAFELWLRVAARRTEEANRARRHVPPWWWGFALGLALGILALAAPRPDFAETPAAWRVIVDRSPSMYLPLEGTTRFAMALRSVRAELLRVGADTTRLEWIDPAANPPIVVRSAGPPDAWLASPRAPRASPGWSALDQPGCVWLTDRVPGPVPARNATVCASGGGAVPGPVAVEGTTRWDWDGAGLVAHAGEGARARIAIEGELPSVLATFVRAWADARGHVVVPRAAAGDEVELVLHGLGARGAEETFGRDGWFARGPCGAEAPSTDADGGLEAWLAGAAARPCVTVGPGRVHVALGEFALTRATEDAFAVSWSALFDRVVLPVPGVVAMTERRDSGSAVLRAGLAPAGSFAGSESARAAARWRAWLALAALVSVVAAWIGSVQVSRGARGSRTLAASASRARSSMLG